MDRLWIRRDLIQHENCRNLTVYLSLPPPRRICFRRCFSVCVSNFAQNFPSGFAWNFQGRLAMANEQLVKFWWRSGSPSGCGDSFPGSSLLGDTESGINRLRCATLQSTSRHRHNDVITSPAVGGGMHCPTASSFIGGSAYNIECWLLICMQEISADECRSLVQGWKDKLANCAAGDHRWGLFYATKSLI